MFVKKASVFLNFFVFFGVGRERPVRVSVGYWSSLLASSRPLCAYARAKWYEERGRGHLHLHLHHNRWSKQPGKSKSQPEQAFLGERERERERSTYCIPLYRQSAGAENSSSTDREAGILYEYCGIHIRIMGSLLRALRFLLLLLLVLLRLRFLRGLFFPLLPWPPDLSRGRRRLQGVSPCRHRRSFKSPDEFYANSVFLSLSIDLYLKDNLISGEGRNFERRNIELPIFRNLKIANV